MARTLLLIAAAAAVLLVAAPQLITAQEPEPTVSLYGLTVPKLDNYFNYTKDISDMQRLTMQGKYKEAADIYYNGKYNRRNATLARNMAGLAGRNFSADGPDGWWAMYSSYYKSGTYLKDLIEAPLNATCGFSCCGMRDAALRIYWRLWQIAFAQHEMDAAIVTGKAIEAIDAFCILASPYDARDNYFSWVRSNSLAACIPEAQDSIDANGVGSNEKYAPAIIAYRNLVDHMYRSTTGNPEADKPAQGAIRLEQFKAVATQFMQAVMVNAKRATARAFSPNSCYNVCGIGSHQAAASAAWRALAPLAARAGPSVQAAINDIPGLLASDLPTASFAQLRIHMANIAAGLGIDFAREVYSCV